MIKSLMQFLNVKKGLHLLCCIFYHYYYIPKARYEVPILLSCHVAQEIQHKPYIVLPLCSTPALSPLGAASRNHYPHLPKTLPVTRLPWFCAGARVVIKEGTDAV